MYNSISRGRNWNMVYEHTAKVWARPEIHIIDRIIHGIRMTNGVRSLSAGYIYGYRVAFCDHVVASLREMGV